MNEEQQIEEICKILTEAAHKACEDIPFAPPSPDDRCIRPNMECHRCKEARALIDAGYRKQSENVKEIFTEIDTALEHEAFDFGTRMRIQIYLKNLKQKYLGGNDDEVQ